MHLVVSGLDDIDDVPLLALVDHRLARGRVLLEHALGDEDARLVAHALEDEMARVGDRMRWSAMVSEGHGRGDLWRWHAPGR